MNNDYDLNAALENIQRLSELALKTSEALNRLSSECQSETIGDLLARTASGLNTYTAVQGEMLDAMERYQLTSSASLAVASRDFDTCNDEFQVLLDRFKSAPTPENERRAYAKKDEMAQFHKTVETLSEGSKSMVSKVVELNLETKKAFENFFSASFAPVVLSEVTKMAISEIAKEFDFTFILKGKAITDRLRKEKEKVVISLLESDRVFVLWETFNESISTITGKSDKLKCELKELGAQIDSG